MGKYINMNKLFRNVRKSKLNSFEKGVVYSFLNDIPDDDLIELRHGAWVDPLDDREYIMWFCSECGQPVKTIVGKPHYKFCPNCAARMKGDETNE